MASDDPRVEAVARIISAAHAIPDHDKSRRQAEQALAAADAVDIVRQTDALWMDEQLAKLREVETDRDRLWAEVNDLRSQLASRFSDPTAPTNFARLLMDSTADAAAANPRSWVKS